MHSTTGAGAAYLTAGTGTGAACTAGAGEAWLTARAELFCSTAGAGALCGSWCSTACRKTLEQDTPSQELVRQALRERRT